MSLKIVQKRGRKVWYIRGTVNGKRYEVSTGTDKKALAEQYRAKAERELHEQAIGNKPQSVSFRYAAEQHIKHGGCPRFLAPLIEHFDATLLTEIKQRDLDFAASVLGRTSLASTRNRQIYSPVSAVLHFGARQGWCGKPVLSRPKLPPGRVRWLTKDEAALLIAAAQPHMRSIIIFLLYTGARVGEALWLDWADVDLDRRHVQFTRTKNGAARGVPLHRLVIDDLSKLEHRVGPVFRRADGKPYTPPKAENLNDLSAGTRIKSGFQGAVRRAGLKDFRPHDCRHTWATWHYQANRDLGALMRLGGWKTMSMVMRYAHTNVDELSHTIDAL